jgi:hypothetical protein
VGDLLWVLLFFALLIALPLIIAGVILSPAILFEGLGWILGKFKEFFEKGTPQKDGRRGQRPDPATGVRDRGAKSDKPSSSSNDRNRQKVVLAVVVVVVLVVGLVLLGSSDSSTKTVKYRDSKVDIGSPLFEPLNRQGDSLVRDAWYDQSNRYMIIDLKGTNYHYCGFPLDRWHELRRAASMANYYEVYIRGSFDCRFGYVPSYSASPTLAPATTRVTTTTRAPTTTAASLTVAPATTRVTTTTRAPTTTAGSTYTYTAAMHAELLGLCRSLPDCKALVNDATRVGTPRTCMPMDIRGWMASNKWWDDNWPAFIEAQCGPVYG